MALRQLPEQWWTGDDYSGKDDWIATIMTGEIPTEVESAEELATTSQRVADWWAGIALKATSDVVEIVVVDLGTDQRPGLFVAAVPNTNPSLWRTAENAFDSLSIRT